MIRNSFTFVVAALMTIGTLGGTTAILGAQSGSAAAPVAVVA
jgi:hypothetical protein